MKEINAGVIPIVESSRSRRPVGVVTDRDIAIRVVAEGRDVARTTTREVMSSPVVTVNPDTDIERVCEILEQRRVRRLPVVDAQGDLVGMVAQADIATHAPERETADVVRSISQPPGTGSRR